MAVQHVHEKVLDGEIYMRDNRFKAKQRGGSLTLTKHLLLAVWAADCVEHALSLFTSEYPDDDRPQKAIEAARAWSRGEISVGEARTTAFDAHASAREVDVKAAQLIARAAGHAAGTAHMADHAPNAAMYVVKAVKASSKQDEKDLLVEEEREWQKQQLPEEIKELVLSVL